MSAPACRPAGALAFPARRCYHGEMSARLLFGRDLLHAGQTIEGT
jgi:hypothetical protein